MAAAGCSVRPHLTSFGYDTCHVTCGFWLRTHLAELSLRAHALMLLTWCRTPLCRGGGAHPGYTQDGSPQESLPGPPGVAPVTRACSMSSCPRAHHKDMSKMRLLRAMVGCMQSCTSGQWGTSLGPGTTACNCTGKLLKQAWCKPAELPWCKTSKKRHHLVAGPSLTWQDQGSGLNGAWAGLASSCPGRRANSNQLHSPAPPSKTP